LKMNTSVIRNDWVGQAVDGRFLLLEWLGGTERGGVFRTELYGPQARKAAIRLIPADTESAESQIDGWMKAAKLSHPHLMRIFHTGRWQNNQADVLYVVTEFAEETLAQVIPERPLTPDETREMLNPVLDALTYLHGQGLVYGRLKPSNILVADSHLKLPVDSLNPAGEFRKPYTHLGVYDAPETANGAITPAADVWSLGITLIEALTQHPPLRDRSANRDPVVSGSVPRPFADIARGCLRYQPSNRSSLREIKTTLERAGLREPEAEIEESAPPGITEPTEPHKAGPSRRGVAAILAAALVLLAVVLFLFLRPHPSQRSLPSAAQSPASATPEARTPSPGPPVASEKGETAKGDVAERIMPDILPSARRTIQGKVAVRVKVMVDASGSVASAAFDSRRESRYFANKAIEAARNWKFKPPRVDGRAVASVWTLRFQFKRNGTDVTPLEVSP
jgi:TonB family protein